MEIQERLERLRKQNIAAQAQKFKKVKEVIRL